MKKIFNLQVYSTNLVDDRYLNYYVLTQLQKGVTIITLGYELNDHLPIFLV